MDIVSAVNKARETFLQHRVKLEAQVDSWFDKLESVDSDIRESLGITQRLALRDLIPELYKDDPSPEVYAVQLEEANRYLSKINNAIMLYNKRTAESALNKFGYDVGNMSLADTIKASNQIREDFLAQRAKKEVEFTNWALKIKGLDSDILAGVELPEDLSLRSLVPELYKDSRDVELCKAQLQRACELTEQINAIVLRYVEEAERCLSEYQEKTSRL